MTSVRDELEELTVGNEPVRLYMSGTGDAPSVLVGVRVDAPRLPGR